MRDRRYHSGAVTYDDDPWALPAEGKVCVVCKEKAPDEAFPYASCKFCKQAPSFHHGRCCPMNPANGGDAWTGESRGGQAWTAGCQQQAWPGMMPTGSSGNAMSTQTGPGWDQINQILRPAQVE